VLSESHAKDPRHAIFPEGKPVFKFFKQDEEPAMGETQQGQVRVEPVDSGVGVPPFRPAAPQAVPAAAINAKESNVARPPFAAPTANPPMPASPTPTRPTATQTTRPAGRDMAAERRTLVVGRGISVQGMVQDAERLVVEGQVEATMIHATELAVSPGGIFKGEVEVEDAEVAGTIDGTITARGNLIVRATGVVLGTARCRRLQVEDGGQITGRIEMIADTKPRPVEMTAPPKLAAEA
jgi:cytoskeletal protein CcmA (bactofilin family)